jgi:dipeptidyl-peptidase 4
MRQFILFISLFLQTCLFAQQPITLEDIWQKGTYATKGIPGFNFQKDGVHYTRLAEADATIEQYDLRTGDKTSDLFKAAQIKTDAKGWNGKFDGYTYSADEQKLMLTTGTESIYRWSSKSDFYIFDPKAKSLTKLHEGDKQQYATFSPDNSKVAFFSNNNLFFKDLSNNNVLQITKDGKTNSIINGASDWVYEEEFELVRAFQWSPDGSKIAYLRFDESAVPEFGMERYNRGAYPEMEKFKYPKVGEKNAVVTAWIYDLMTQKTIQVKTTAKDDDYLPRITWTDAQNLCITWMNRHQNHLKLLLADAKTGECKTLYEEENKYYIDLKEVIFLEKNAGFIVQSEKNGFNHLYLHSMSGKEICPLTKGKFDVTDFYGVNVKDGTIAYQAASKNPMQRELFTAKLNGKGRKKVSNLIGHNSAQYSSTMDYFVNSNSTINTPPSYAVFDKKGKLIRKLEQNDKVKTQQEDIKTIPLTFFDFKTSTNVKLNGWMIKPTDPQFANQKLPTLMFVYGGPGSQQVLDQWKGANYWWFQMLAQKGFVIACVDNRGTGARGEEFKKMTYLNLGKYEVEDQIEAAKYLGKQDFIDPERIGIFGWSYGGFMSTNCVLKGGDTFKAAVAVAPVTNWKWYDSVYTERYMRTESENPKGYAENSPVNYADMLNGNFLLVHGLADDNVHFQHTAELANQLIAADKQFDTMIYPNRNHGISGGNSRIHLYTLMTRFLEEKLKGTEANAIVKP